MKMRAWLVALLHAGTAAVAAEARPRQTILQAALGEREKKATRRLQTGANASRRLRVSVWFRKPKSLP
jgi:hypothetical protein